MLRATKCAIDVMITQRYRHEFGVDLQRGSDRGSSSLREILAVARHLAAYHMSRDECRTSYQVLIPRPRRAQYHVPWRALGFLLVVAGVGYVTIAAVLQSIRRFP